MSSIIHVESLTKKYGKVIALNNISVDIPEGITALIGPNGSGKTTLINLIIGLIKPSIGKISVFGLDPWLNGDRVRELVTVLHEKPRFPSWYTGLEYLLYVANVYGVFNPRDRIQEVASKVGIEKSLHRRIGEYSAGMVQRLALAHVLLSNPKLIILDEPTANLDPKARIEFLDLIINLRKYERISFILSSHVLPELERACNFVVFLHYGRILLASDIKDLVRSSCILEYKIHTNDDLLLFQKAKEVLLGNIELSESGLLLKASTLEEVKSLLKLILDSGLNLNYIAPERSFLETLYLLALNKQK
ncbi:MAG: ABC transporter ATP-binding protein [Thermoproteota archaeon]